MLKDFCIGTMDSWVECSLIASSACETTGSKSGAIADYMGSMTTKSTSKLTHFHRADVLTGHSRVENAREFNVRSRACGWIPISEIPSPQVGGA